MNVKVDSQKTLKILRGPVLRFLKVFRSFDGEITQRCGLKFPPRSLHRLRRGNVRQTGKSIRQFAEWTFQLYNGLQSVNVLKIFKVSRT